MREFRSELRRRRQACGMTLTALAESVSISKGHLSRIENGRSRPTSRIVRLCDERLDAKGELVALLPQVCDEAAARLPRPSGMPGPPHLFIGRSDELAALASMLDAQGAGRVCVISGLAGVGKTALALTAAHANAVNFPYWRLYVDLRGHTPGTAPATSGEAAYRLLSQLRVSPDQIPPDAEERSSALRMMLRGLRALIVLDNVATAGQVRPLLVNSPDCRFIVTSRNRLAALDEAHHLPLETLPQSDAVVLFRAVAGDKSSEDKAAVTEIVRRCGTLPLAVRIAAARFATGNWTADRFLDRITRASSVLPALNDGERDVAAAFRVSFQELAAEDRRTLALLAVHPSGAITTGAAEALMGVREGDLDYVLDRLHNAHLATRDLAGDIHLHDLVRAFAARATPKSIDQHARREAVLRLVDHALRLATAADEMLEPHRFRRRLYAPAPSRRPFVDTEQALAWLRARWGTLTAIALMADGDPRCWQLALVLRAFFFREKLHEPWIATHEAALVTARALGDQLASAMVLNNLGMAHLERGSLEEAMDHHSAALAAFAQAGDRHGELDAISSIAWVRLYQGAPEDAVHGLSVALDVYRRSGRTRNAVIALRGLALASAALDCHDDALAYAREAKDLAQLPVDVVMCLNCLAWVCFRANQLGDADRLYRKAVQQAELTGSSYERTRALIGLGNIAARRGEAALAVALWNNADESRLLVNPVVVGEGAARSSLEPMVETTSAPRVRA
ncbi:NB-ARC domain-containing protein [Micromonospora sp. WMMD1076]|uniref:helix-turn-helix domain-containing protein n=1 Tax=Micromonospora sp. WMMD1076 TaxID=3016103 RepID=UPI00249AF7A8|nr:helix-turn-helix domain-containing protein [Micromonospora sp. WMMD1076]WFF08711.1 NB-ARC domain-containing protein [Micromonospora sp. WMMD1076]